MSSHAHPNPQGQPGADAPDSRGRTGLHREGLDLARNENVAVERVDVTSDGWHVLRRTTFRYRGRDGSWTTQQRETYDRGNGATILLYDLEQRKVLLGRQFRYPVYVNGHPDGMLLETAAGLLDGDSPEAAIRREAQEELGVAVGEVTPVFELFMSPGSVTERIHFFAAPWSARHPVEGGGGLEEEGEEIEPVALDFDEALQMVASGEIQDAKTVLLLQWAALTLPWQPAVVPERTASSIQEGDDHA